MKLDYLKRRWRKLPYSKNRMEFSWTAGFGLLTCYWLFMSNWLMTSFCGFMTVYTFYEVCAVRCTTSDLRASIHTVQEALALARAQRKATQVPEILNKQHHDT